jgi:glycosyltransferase involved in cell wall biosynthesis
MAEPHGVLHVVDCLNIGGTERQMFELLRRLDRRRWRVHLVTFKPGGELLPQLKSIGIEPIVLPLGGSLTRPQAALAVARLAWLIRKENVRVVHAHDFYSNIIGVAAATMARVRAIASRRDLAHWLNPTQRKLLACALQLADCVIANAEAVGERVRTYEHVPATKLRIVPNGIDVAHFDALSRVEPDPPLPPARDGRPRVAMVASMHLPDKGHRDLLQAAARLASRGVCAQWLLVSDGALRTTLQEEARALGLDDVHFLGRRSDVPAILSGVDLVAHPSWAEGFPNAVLEGMCASKPVVATRVGGIPEVMRDQQTGFLVEPRQPSALAEKLGVLLTDPARRQEMGRAGRLRVEGVYSLERMTATIDELYRVLSGLSRASALAA